MNSAGAWVELISDEVRRRAMGEVVLMGQAKLNGCANELSLRFAKVSLQPKEGAFVYVESNVQSVRGHEGGEYRRAGADKATRGNGRPADTAIKGCHDFCRLELELDRLAAGLSDLECCHSVIFLGQGFFEVLRRNPACSGLSVP